MANDHYIPQVYLRQFTPEGIVGRLNAVRKSNGERFSPGTQNVCAINQGSTNHYLIEDRAIEKFLLSVEPHYQSALQAFRSREITPDSIHVIAGLIAYISTSAPAAMRLSTASMKFQLQSFATSLDKHEKLPKVPKELGGGSLADLLASGKLKLDVDEKYPQAVGISQVIEQTARFGNSCWDILINKNTGHQFLTSDFPLAIEDGDDPRFHCKLVPLAPDLAVRVIPDLSLSREEAADINFAKFRYRYLDVGQDDVTDMNALIVRCAEDFIFLPNDNSDLRQLVEDNRSFRIEVRNTEIPSIDGSYLISQQQVCRVEW